MPPDSPDPIIVASFPDQNAKVYLTHDWDKQYFHFDRSNAIATLLLTGLVGIQRFGRLSVKLNNLLRLLFGRHWVFIRNLERETKRTRQARLESHSGSGCCLVYRAQGELVEPLILSSSRKIGKIGFALDGLDNSIYRNAHKDNLHNTGTAVSIALTDTTGSPETRFLSDVIYLTGNDGLVIYSRIFQAGTLEVVITTMPTEQIFDAVKEYVSGLTADQKLAAAASLFTMSQYKSNDNLRSFIAAWSAFELLIFRLEKKYRSEWQALLQSEYSTLPEWDVDLSPLDTDDYRLRDRFYAVACTMNLDEAEPDTKQFSKLNSKRNDYYHRLKIQDTDLPTHDVQSLFRKYLKLALSRK